MFSKIERTEYPPKSKPVLIWDGECGFCKYWVTRLKYRTGKSIDFKTFQEFSRYFPDIPLKEFKKASRLIETDGQVYSGPDSLYRGLDYADKRIAPWHKWYRKYHWFMGLNDFGYNYIAKNRPLMFKITKALFGRRPERPQPYWLVYLLIFVGIIVALVKVALVE